MPLLAISELTVGFYDNPPKIFEDKLSGQAAGFWADITNQIGKDADINIKWVFGTWPQCLERLYSGEIDVMIDVADIASRKDNIIFTKEMVYLSWSTIYTHKKNDVNSLLDFSNTSIGVLSGSVNYDQKGGVVDLFRSFDINVNFKEFSSYTDLLDAVAEGRIYAGVASKDIGDMYSRSGRINTTPFWFQPIHLKYALSVNNPKADETIALLDKYIASYKKDINSIYYRAIDKHIDKQKVKYFPEWAIILLAILSILIIIFYLFNRILAAKVRVQTRDLTKEITERKVTQHKLEQTMKKLEGLNKVKDNFLRSVSHELLTPLNAILGFSDVLLTKDHEINPELRREYVITIKNSGTKLLKIVNDMIDATLINSKLMSITSEKINIYDWVLKLFNSYPKADNLKYSLQINNAVDRSLKINSDFDKLRKILIHLMDNASKFTEKGEISLGYTINSDTITFFVKDTGIGISAKNKEIIFQGFTQVQNDKNRFSEGSGLGLAIVYALVTSLQGKIWVESTINKGSTFYIQLPKNLANQSINDGS